MLEIAAKHEVEVSFCDAETTRDLLVREDARGKATYVWQDRGVGNVPKRWMKIGFFSCDEKAMATFFHELGHIKTMAHLGSQNARKGLRGLRDEVAAWEEGMRIAEEEGVRFRAETVRWSFECLSTYTDELARRQLDKKRKMRGKSGS